MQMLSGSARCSQRNGFGTLSITMSDWQSDSMSGDPNEKDDLVASAMTERFNLFFRFFAKHFFQFFSLDEAVVTRLKALEARGSVVYVMRYSSRLDYFLFNTLFLRHGLRLSSFANAIHFYYYRPLGSALSIMTRMRRGRPREVEHSEDRSLVTTEVKAGRSLFLFLRTQRLESFLRRRRSEKRTDELDLIAEVVRAARESNGDQE
ncbi:MAG: hypothetical protein VCB25_03315, partial [Myxococcota bacterium]